MFAPFHYAFVQRGVWEVLLLSIGAGVIGTWIVLRGLAFFSHALGTAAFPGLVLAAGAGFSPLLGAAGAAAAFALAVLGLGRRESERDSATALVLVGMLAVGVVLASDVYHSEASVESLLFGSLLLVGPQELVEAGVVSAAAVALTFVLGRRWLAVGFDADNARAFGVRAGAVDLVLLALVALAVLSALNALGALLVTSLLVVPAATARLWTDTLRTWRLASVALAAAEGVVGLWLSVELNVPPGAAIAVLAGGVFALAAVPRLVPLGLAALVLAGCGGGPTASVVATTTQIGDWTRIVAGPAIAVHQILRPNTDPHEYEPRPADVEATSGAKVVLVNGVGLDGWADKLVKQAGGRPTVDDLSAAIPVKLDKNPHWWFDPRNAEAAVGQIASELAQAFPGKRARIATNAARYVAQLKTMDASIARCFAQVPRAQRKLVTSHDAFPYFANRYGITIVGAVIPSQTTQAEPSARDTARLIALIRREHVKAVFPEKSINPRLAQTIARETGASSKYVLYGDTLGPNQTYVQMMRWNADQMVRGFTGGRRHC